MQVIKDSYLKYLCTHRRSNEKLKILHGAIANDLQNQLGSNFLIKSYGIGDNKENKMKGRYIDKQVDIFVGKNNQSAHNSELGGIAIKFIMSNYSQNSNNYFESMLGETANIRSCNKAYFQIIILPEQLPYFSSSDQITKIETITAHNLNKYTKLSNDNTNEFMHTPNKTLLYLIKTPNLDTNATKTREDFAKARLQNFQCTTSEQQFEFGNTVIYNDYEQFISKVSYYFLSI